MAAVRLKQPAASSAPGFEHGPVLCANLTEKFHVKHFCPIMAKNCTMLQTAGGLGTRGIARKIGNLGGLMVQGWRRSCSSAITRAAAVTFDHYSKSINSKAWLSWPIVRPMRLPQPLTRLCCSRAITSQARVLKRCEYLNNERSLRRIR
jgi:hypothetical protein